MLGASARLSCLHTPVETITPPRRRGKLRCIRDALREWASLISLRCPLAHRRGIAIPGPFGSANRAAFLFRANPLTRKGYAASVWRQSRRRLPNRWVLRGSLGNVLWGRVFCFPQTAGWGPSDSLHCSISPRRIVLHFCDICRGKTYRSDSFFGSGYASPWVSTRMDLITTGVFGLSFQRLVGTWEMRTASSTPSVTWPKAA